MDSRKQFVFNSNRGGVSGIGALITFILIIVGIYYLIKGVYFVLGIIAPALLIATLIIDFKVVTGYLKFLLDTLKKNPILGIIFILMTVIGSPFVAGYLFAKAMMKRSLKKYTQPLTQEQHDQYTEYEEVVDDESFLELPKEKEAIRVKKESNNYDDLFE